MKKSDLLALLDRAINRAEEDSRLTGDASAQARAIGLRAAGRAEAYRAVRRALLGDAVSLRIDAIPVVSA